MKINQWDKTQEILFSALHSSVSWKVSVGCRDQMRLLPTPNLRAWILQDLMAIEVQWSSIKLVVCFVYGYNRGSQTDSDCNPS